MRARDLLRLLRPKQWTKNLLVFAAILFTGRIAEKEVLVPVLLAFLAMCLVSSATYVVNDLVDLERDRQHPKKRLRPLASGAVPRHIGIVLASLLFVGGTVLAFFLGPMALAIIAAYLLIQLLYNAGLKKVAVADVFAISLGFILRAVLGAAVMPAEISAWLLFCTGALALMIGFSKRRSEFISQGEERSTSRESLADYSRSSLDALVILFAGGATLCYGVYAIESDTAHRFPGLFATTLFVVYGISRYVMIVFSKDEGGEPETLLFRDPHLWMCLLGFIAAAVLAVSGVRLPLVGG